MDQHREHNSTSIGKTAISAMHGFTLTEILIVLAILGILAAIAVPSYGLYVESAKLSASIAILDSVKLDMEGYREHHDAYPADINFTDFTDPDGNPVITSMTNDYLHSKMFSWDSYVVAGTSYTIIVKAADKNHTIITLTPTGVVL